MNVAFSKQAMELKTQESKWKKLFATIKKFLAKEFLWALFSLLLALPLAIISVYLLEIIKGREFEKFDYSLLIDNSLFVSSFIVNLAGIYFARTVVGAIKTLTKEKTTP